MRPLQLGFVLPMLEDPQTGDSHSWSDLERKAVWAETVGFDTVWTSDELLWKVPSWSGPSGFWECVAITGAVAATTSSIQVGTWVMSALHRNAGLTAKTAETLDEISGGRFLLGLGAGHAGSQGRAFGYPTDMTVSRYEEALQIIIPALREGKADFSGEFHGADDLILRPRGPRPGQIPIMLAGHGPRNIDLAVRHGDIWSAFATTSSLPEAFKDMMDLVDKACEDQGRDAATLGRSVGVFVEPTEVHVAEEIGLGVPLAGSVDEIAERIHEFAAMGVTMLELIPSPNDEATAEALVAVLEALDK